MLPQFPLTALMTLLSVLVMGSAWLYLRSRQHNATTSSHVLTPVRYMQNFFFYIMIFSSLITVPYLWLPVSPEAFSEAMAWGYVVGHIFCYLAFMNIARMVCALVPKLAGIDRPLVVIWLIVTAVVTVINAQTMIWGVQPVFNYAANLTEFRAAPIVGIAIAVIASVAIIPAVILFGINVFRTSGHRRVKSILLLLGFLTIMIAGPLHDVARSGLMYALADIFSIVGIILIGTGVAYHFEQGLSRNPAQASPAQTVIAD